MCVFLRILCMHSSILGLIIFIHVIIIIITIYSLIIYAKKEYYRRRHFYILRVNYCFFIFSYI